MAFVLDKEELGPGLILFRRGDVKHGGWYCRIKLSGNRYQTISLGTENKEEARRLARKRDAAFRARLKRGEPGYNPLFVAVARAYMARLHHGAIGNDISLARLKRIEAIVSKRLLPYCGTMPLSRVATEGRPAYLGWRRATSSAQRGKPVSNATVASEASIFNAILNFAVKQGYLDSNERFDSRPKFLRERRDGFTKEQFHDLMTVAEGWIADAPRSETRWYRTMAVYFMQVMVNTGIRPGEAARLRWRDIEAAHDNGGRPITVLRVRHREKPRLVVAPASIGETFGQIRAMSRATAADDPVFTEITGQPAKTLCRSLIRDVLDMAGLSHGPGSVQRSTYSFRHAYGVERLIAGVDPYMLALQMGTSVQTIEEQYGHAMLIRHAGSLLGNGKRSEPEPYFRRRRTRAFGW